MYSCLQFPTIKGLRLLSLEIKVDILPFFTILSIFQENNHWENFSCQCINKVEHYTAERRNIFRNCSMVQLQCSLPPLVSWMVQLQCSLPPLVSKWHLLHSWPGQSFGRMTAPYWSLVKQLLRVPSRVASASSGRAIQFRGGFNRPKNELRRIFHFIIYAHQQIKKFHLTIWMIFIHYMQQPWYRYFLPLVLQNAMNTGCKVTSTMGTLPCRLPWRLCVSM